MGIEFKNKILAVAVFLFGLAAFYFMLHWTTSFANLYTTDTLGTALFWVGYAALVICVLLLKPIMMMASNDKVELWYLGTGVLIFMVGTLAFHIGGQLLDPILGLSGFSTQNEYTNINQLFSFAYLLIGILAMDLLPIYYIMVKA